MGRSGWARVREPLVVEWYNEKVTTVVQSPRKLSLAQVCGNLRTKSTLTENTASQVIRFMMALVSDKTVGLLIYGRDFLCRMHSEAFPFRPAWGGERTRTFPDGWGHAAREAMPCKLVVRWGRGRHRPHVYLGRKGGAFAGMVP